VWEAEQAAKKHQEEMLIDPELDGEALDEEELHAI